jgi:hydroxyacylglutathione hydrolase
VRLLNDLYVYPWLSMEANNANTVFVDGPFPTLIDPGHLQLFSHVVESMAREGRSIDKVRLVLGTHSHPDHIESVQLFDREVLRAVSRSEMLYLEGSGKDLFMMTGSQFPARPFQILLKEGLLQLGDKTFSVIPTPGHSPGSICLYWEAQRVLISGDTVFYMGIGRTDFEGGDPSLLKGSVERLAALDIDYLIPGHGQIVKGREAIQRNFSLILDEFF